ARLEIRLRPVLSVDALVVGTNTTHALAVVQQFGACESSENGDPCFLNLAAQPFHKAVERDHVIAMIAQRRRRDGKLEFSFLREEINRFLADGRVERSVHLKSWDQLAHGAGIEQGAGKAVLADFTGLLQHVNIFFAEWRIRMLSIVLVDELRTSYRTSHAGRPAADNNDVGIHAGMLDIGERFAKDQHSALSIQHSGSASRRCRHVAVFIFLISSINGGTISNRLPTTA